MRSVTTSVIAATLLATVGLLSTQAADTCCTSADSGKVRHVVLFKFKDGTAAEDIQKVEAAFRALPTKIPEIAAFEWGTNISPESKAQGFTHCFFLTFKDAKARDAYLPHPEHKAFGKVLRPFLDKVLVIDYVAKD
jgi:hypothetical protein